MDRERWSGRAGEIATGTVDDGTTSVVEAWTGPQVAWRMARGSPGAFGGTKINSYTVWLGLSALFLIGLFDWRARSPCETPTCWCCCRSRSRCGSSTTGTSSPRCRSPTHRSFGSWLRCLWIARTDRPSRGVAVWPVWVLAAATVFAAGFRIGLNTRSSNVIDVGYSGIIGADRIVHGQSPYGHFPVEDPQPKCGPADSSGEVRDRIQTNGRCETANPLGDTYGPVSYLAYIPGYAIFGWSHKWDSLPGVHFTSILFDSLCLLGLALVGRRFGGPRLAARSRSRGSPGRSRSTHRARTRTTRSRRRS